jgi:hypothetical protein
MVGQNTAVLHAHSTSGRELQPANAAAPAGAGRDRSVSTCVTVFHFRMAGVAGTIVHATKTTFMVSAGHSSNQEAAKLACFIKGMLYISVTCCWWSHCDLVASGAVCVLACCANSEYTHGECWSLSNQEATKLAWVIKGMLYISVTCLLVSHLCDIVAAG